MNILDLYQQDITDKVITVAGGREYRGPCPVCGGEDRFGVFPQQNNGAGSFFCGRAKGGGKGCGIGGDGIQYLIDVRKMNYPQACDYLGIEKKGSQTATRYRYQLPEVANKGNGGFVPEKKGYPAEVADSDLWCTKGMDFVEKCHEALLNRPTSIAYLLARGITREGIQKFKIGFYAGEERKGVAYSPSFRARSAWGLSEKKNDKGKPAMLILPAGLIIPYLVDGVLHRITIRLIKPDPSQPRKKYHYVVGSIRDLFVTHPNARAFMAIEAELDCIAVDCAAGDLIGTLGLGSTGTRPDARAAALIDGSACLLDGLDYDQAGSAGGDFLRATYPQYKRWPVPVGKDPGESFQAGVDLRKWILLGLPEFLQADRRKAEDGELKKEEEKNDLMELRELLAECGGAIRIYDGGVNVAKEVPKNWRLANPVKSGRISELLYASELVGEFVGMVGDGMYGADRISVTI